jgi:hypothetical protein
MRFHIQNSIFKKVKRLAFGSVPLEYGILNMKCVALLVLLSTLSAFGQNGGADTDQDGLPDHEESRYGLSPYLADTNLNGRPDLQQVQDWEFAFPPDRPAWTAEWIPIAGGTYRFTLNASEQVRFKVNDTVIPPYSGNTYEVSGLLAEKLMLSVERTDSTTPPSAAAALTASFIDGLDADGDGLSLDWEMALHTDPAKSDTDGDGLNDGEEVIRYATDPLGADSNFNGLPDYIEVLTLPAAQAIEGEGFWEEKLESIAARNPTKALLYRLPLPYAGVYRLGAVTHPNSTASGTLKFYVDGILRGESLLQPGAALLYHWIDLNIDQPVNVAEGRPSLSHVVRVEWENKTPGADAGELILQQVYVDFIDNHE